MALTSASASSVISASTMPSMVTAQGSVSSRLVFFQIFFDEPNS